MRKCTAIPVLAILILSCVAVDAPAQESAMVEDANVLDFDLLWDYNKPGETRAKFKERLAEADRSKDLSYYLQLQTQIARTYGLERVFDSAHVLLDEVASQLHDELRLVKVRYLLERGRVLNTSGQPQEAMPLFVQAYELGDTIGADFFAVDAAHMVALVAETRQERLDWSHKGIAIAENSTDERARAWLGSIYNNVGWDYHGAEEYEDALDMFEKALAYQRQTGKQQAINIARWCVARAYRSLGRIDDALVIQLELEEAHQNAGTKGGFVWEELAELYTLKQYEEKAQQYAAKAYGELAKMDWLAAEQPERLERLKKMGNVDDN